MTVGIVEREFLNMPRDIIFDDSPRVMSKPTDDPIFWSVKDMAEDWSRFIDDVLVFFKGDREKAHWFFDKLNSLYPGDVHLKWEFSDESIIFLDLEIILNRETKKIETKIYVKPSNKQLFLNYRSNHPAHVFKSIVYSQALRGVINCTHQEWAIDFMRLLKNKFLAQEYPECLVNQQLERALQVNRADLLFRDKKDKKKRRPVICPLVTTHNEDNPPFNKWIAD